MYLVDRNGNLKFFNHQQNLIVTINLKGLDIQLATSEERDWTAGLIAGSEPWIALGTSLEQCRKVCRHPEYLLFVAHFQGTCSGSIILHPLGLASSPYIKSVVVSDAFRGRGIGASLIAFAENYFRKDSKHIFLCASSFNTRARTFYERLGYNPVGEFKDYVIEGESEMLYHKRLR